MLLAMGIAVVVLVLVGALALLYLFREASDSGRSLPATKRQAAFKVRYGLNVRQPIAEFEAKMLDGMRRERNEVWVAAFCNESEVLRVTANVGSRRKSHATDNLANWPTVAQQVGASRIRHYHSHPPALGCSLFSPMDEEMYSNLRSFLERHGLQFNAFLVYPGFLGLDYRIKPFTGQ